MASSWQRLPKCIGYRLGARALGDFSEAPQPRWQAVQRISAATGNPVQPCSERIVGSNLGGDRGAPRPRAKLLHQESPRIIYVVRAIPIRRAASIGPTPARISCQYSSSTLRHLVRPRRPIISTLQILMECCNETWNPPSFGEPRSRRPAVISLGSLFSVCRSCLTIALRCFPGMTASKCQSSRVRYESARNRSPMGRRSVPVEPGVLSVIVCAPSRWRRERR